LCEFPESEKYVNEMYLIGWQKKEWVMLYCLNKKKKEGKYKLKPANWFYN